MLIKFMRARFSRVAALLTEETAGEPGGEGGKAAPAPARLKNAARWLADALLLGGGWKKSAVYFATWLALWPGLGMVFAPRAEKVLAEEGLRPELVQELAPGKRVYILSDNAWGKAHALLQWGPAGLPASYYEVVRRGAEAANAFSSILSLNAVGFCAVYVHASELRREPPREMQHVLLHEIRHCSDDNVRLLKGRLLDTLDAEGEAEYRAIATLAREKKSDALRRQLFSEEVIGGADTPDNPNSDAKHDVALYLDAAFNGRAIPSADEIVAANRAASKTYGILMKGALMKEWTRIETAEGVSTACGQPENRAACAYDLAAQHLSPLALRRAELYRDAARDMMRDIVRRDAAAAEASARKEAQAARAVASSP